jgi:hypothetical protein
MAYRERWEAEIEEMRRVLAGFAMQEECKWGKPTYTMDGKIIVILKGFKEYFARVLSGSTAEISEETAGAVGAGSRQVFLLDLGAAHGGVCGCLSYDCCSDGQTLDL